MPGEWSEVGSLVRSCNWIDDLYYSVYLASNVGQRGSRKDPFFAKALRERGSVRRGADFNMAANLNPREKEGVKKQCVDIKAVKMSDRWGM